VTEQVADPPAPVRLHGPPVNFPLPELVTLTVPLGVGPVLVPLVTVTVHAVGCPIAGLTGEQDAPVEVPGTV
jgi:hypothetical protein